jgi:hypothetical protein
MKPLPPTILFVLFLSVFMLSNTGARAEAPSFHLRLEHLSSQVSGAVEELREVQGRCEGRYNQLPWKTFPKSSCDELAEYIRKHQKELSKRPAVRMRSFHLGMLSWGNEHRQVDLSTAAQCDVNFENCHNPVLDPASKLAQRLRETLTRTLGRLPIHH